MTRPPAPATSCLPQHGASLESWRSFSHQEEEPPRGLPYSRTGRHPQLHIRRGQEPLPWICARCPLIEGIRQGSQLLDQHIKCGDSLVGVFDLRCCGRASPTRRTAVGETIKVNSVPEAQQAEKGGQLSLGWRRQDRILTAWLATSAPSGDGGANSIDVQAKQGL